MSLCVYTYDKLVELATSTHLPVYMHSCLDHLFSARPYQRMWGHGHRAGQRMQWPITVMVSNQQPHTISSTIPIGRLDTKNPKPLLVSPLLVSLSMQCHLNMHMWRLRIGLLNIRSVNSKTENVLDLLEDHWLNILLMTETWHKEADIVAVRRLRSLGLNVIEAARPILKTSRLDNVNFINHGGLAAVAKPGINIARLETKTNPKTFEHLCCRVGGKHTPFIMVAIYRPG